MDRGENLKILQKGNDYDIIIIGGGATGLGCAVDAVSRGYKTLLLEKNDFAKGTSSRSTKLVHGGVRYLAQGNIHLVREALLERGRLLRNAPHVCHKLPFVVPVYSWWRKIYYGFGLWLYETLSGKLSLGKTKLLLKSNVMKKLPNLSSKGLKGGVLYFDGQFDDSRLAINLAQTANELGAVVLNYFGVTGFLRQGNLISGVTAKDEISGLDFAIKAKVVINATGVFADALLQIAEGHEEHTITPSQGIHLVLDRDKFEGTSALLIPKTQDGRVLFIIPWHDKIIIGTTDTLVEKVASEPRPLKEEVDFVIQHFNKYSATKIKYSDIKSVYAGLRPLANVGSEVKTSVISREHKIKIFPSGLVDIAGGKWTTYRKMAEQTVDKAVRFAEMNFVPSKTKRLKIHGYTKMKNDSHLSVYGTDALKIEKLMIDQPLLAEKIHKKYPYTKAEVVWVVKNEMAQTIEDVLARRIRLLFLDAKAAIEAGPIVAGIMASLLGEEEEWQDDQVALFNQLAQGYLVN